MIPKLLRSERLGSTLLLVPVGRVSSLIGDEARPELDGLLGQLQQPEVKHVVVDFAEVSYFGSIMLTTLHAIWKNVRAGGGKMALCNVSEVVREILQISQFDTLWPVCDSREEALALVAE